MARLKDAPNIVRCEDINVVMNPDGIGCCIYIRMELLTPLRDCEKLQGFDEAEIIRLGRRKLLRPFFQPWSASSLNSSHWS